MGSAGSGGRRGKGGGLEKERLKERKSGKKRERNVGGLIVQPTGRGGPSVLPRSGSRRPDTCF